VTAADGRPPARPREPGPGLAGALGPREAVLRAGVAVGLAVLAVAPRVALQPFLGEQGRWILPTLAVAISATFLGLWPGLITLLVAAIATVTLVVSGSLTMDDTLALTLFAATAGAVLLLASRVRDAYAESRRNEVAATSRAGQLDAILRSMPDQVFVHDRSGRAIAANEPARAASGSLPDLAGVLARYGLDGLPLDGPVEAEDRTVPDRWAEVTATVALDGEASILVIQDVTERRHAAERQAALATMFSHELRTPLTIIGGYAALLRARRVAPEVASELLDGIDAESGRMRALIDDLLVLARGGAGEAIDREPVVVRPLIEEAVRSEAARLGVQVDLTLPAQLPLVDVDRDALGHVIRSLLANAAKYAPGSPVHVLAAAGEDGGPVVVRIRDEGPGIAPGDEERIFRLFYRSPAARGIAGSGVGLYVCRALLEGFGGRISAASASEGGAEFLLELPRFVDEDAPGD
jgi:signal transduction histidine kinase